MKYTMRGQCILLQAGVYGTVECDQAYRNY